MASFARHLVSKKKRRFIEDGYDLDLVFITDNLVAMGFPAQGKEALYRNPLSEVQRFLDTRHQDHYKVYNLCAEAERQYDPEVFHGRVACFPFLDHQSPPFTLLEAFCKDAHAWLQQDKNNVVVTHCKAGKGRTGVMICAYLLYSGTFKTADEALDYYGEKRTYNGKGVTIPSQRRYIHYFEQYLRTLKQEPYVLTSLTMSSLIIFNPPDEPTIRITLLQGSPNPEQLLQSPWQSCVAGEVGGQPAFILHFGPTVVSGDVCVVMEKRKGQKGEKLCAFWFNTFFQTDSSFRANQSQIDKANKDKDNKKFPVGFSVEINFRQGSIF